jgi:carnitine 3-dehydrogenase
MKPNDEIRTVAVVGTGLIGSGWAAYFLAQGLDVVATDPAPNAQADMEKRVDRVWPLLQQLGLRPGASRARLRFHSGLEEAVAGADFVQESGPERDDLKRELFARLDGVLPPDVILASSSSGLKMSSIQSRCRHPERCVIGHPFNPPYLVPLVEVVGGARTSPEALQAAMRVYASINKHPILLRKEATGHVANRLQAAIWREAIHLVAEGVVSVEDVDAAVYLGPGLRWSFMGPHLTFHLAGGDGGMEHFLDHLAGPVGTWWADLGRPELTPEVKSLLVQGVTDEAAGRSMADLEAKRDEMLLKLLTTLKVSASAPGVVSKAPESR